MIECLRMNRGLLNLLYEFSFCKKEFGATLKLAFDVDGVITEMPEFYSAITHALKAQGHTVIVLTDFDEYFRDQRVRELASYNIAYDELVITAEKKQYCIDNNIDYALDDTPSYYRGIKSHPIGIYQINDAI